MRCQQLQKPARRYASGSQKLWTMVATWDMELVWILEYISCPWTGMSRNHMSIKLKLVECILCCLTYCLALSLLFGCCCTTSKLSGTFGFRSYLYRISSSPLDNLAGFRATINLLSGSRWSCMLDSSFFGVKRNIQNGTDVPGLKR